MKIAMSEGNPRRPYRPAEVKQINKLNGDVAMIDGTKGNHPLAWTSHCPYCGSPMDYIFEDWSCTKCAHGRRGR